MTEHARPVLQFHPEPYGRGGSRIMGRHAAGAGFLRGFVETRTGPVTGFQHGAARREDLAAAVAAIDPAAPVAWIPLAERAALRRHDVLVLPGPGLAEEAEARQRHGADAWALAGITHTLATTGVLRAIAAFAAAPVMPWDALVCTSTAARHVVETVLAAEEERLRLRLGARSFQRPMLPVIPLGVHVRDFTFTDGMKAVARQRLGLAEDEIAVIFTGRLSFHAKAHPLAMYAGLQEAQARTGRRIALVQSSWFANAAIEQAFKDGAARFAAGVRMIWSDGGDDTARRDVWACADLFLSLSDNIQETFGLAPVEAMAAGIPVVVSDWDGYRDTVRDGIDGFRVLTTMPASPSGEAFAAAYEGGAGTYDWYCGATSLAVGLDHAALADRLTALVSDAGLRRRLGAAGHQRALSTYDWRVVMGQHAALWAESRAMRLASRARDGDPCRPGAPLPAGLDPFAIFASFPSRLVDASAMIGPGVMLDKVEVLLAHPLFGHVGLAVPGREAVLATLVATARAGRRASLAEVAAQAGWAEEVVVLCACILAKMDVLRFTEVEENSRDKAVGLPASRV